MRILRFFRFHARFGYGVPDADAVAACARRANDLMALSRERIADEMLKLLGVTDPAPTVAIMLEYNILRPVLPEITAARFADLTALMQASDRRIAPDPLRRLVALLPRDPDNRRRRRLAAPPVQQSAQAGRLRRGDGAILDCPGTRLPHRARMRRRPAVARRQSRGGRRHLGLEGPAPADQRRRAYRAWAGGRPVVARTLRQIEDRWVEAGFPGGEAFEDIVSDALGRAD